MYATPIATIGIASSKDSRLFGKISKLIEKSIGIPIAVAPITWLALISEFGDPKSLT
jgi:hypothetical protein